MAGLGEVVVVVVAELGVSGLTPRAFERRRRVVVVAPVGQGFPGGRSDGVDVLHLGCGPVDVERIVTCSELQGLVEGGECVRV